MDLKRHRRQRRRGTCSSVEECPEGMNQVSFGQRERRDRERGVPQGIDGRPRSNGFRAPDAEALHSLEQRDPAAFSNRPSQVVVFRRRPGDFEENVHHDRRDAAARQTANHAGVYVSWRRPLLGVEAQLMGRGPVHLLGRSPVDRDYDDVGRRVDGPSYGEQPAEPQVFFQSNAHRCGAQNSTESPDDQTVDESLPESRHGHESVTTRGKESPWGESLTGVRPHQVDLADTPCAVGLSTRANGMRKQKHTEHHPTRFSMHIV